MWDHYGGSDHFHATDVVHFWVLYILYSVFLHQGTRQFFSTDFTQAGKCLPICPAIPGHAFSFVSIFTQPKAITLFNWWKMWWSLVIAMISFYLWLMHSEAAPKKRLLPSFLILLNIPAINNIYFIHTQIHRHTVVQAEHIANCIFRLVKSAWVQTHVHVWLTKICSGVLMASKNHSVMLVDRQFAVSPLTETMK